jgi:hypothetical protein
METENKPKWANVWGFFAATYAASWLIWLPAILWRGGEPKLLFVVLGAFVPSTMGIIFVYRTRDRAGRQDFWRRVIDVRRIGWRWGVVIVLVFPLAYTLSGVAFTLVGGDLPPLKEIQPGHFRILGGARLARLCP